MSTEDLSDDQSDGRYLLLQLNLLIAHIFIADTSLQRTLFSRTDEMTVKLS